MIKVLKIIFAMFIALTILCSNAYCGIFKVGNDGSIEDVNDYEQICFINHNDSIEDLVLYFQLNKEYSNVKYFLLILPVPASLNDIQLIGSGLCRFYNVSPFFYYENLNSSLFFLKNYSEYKFTPNIINDSLNYSFLKVYCYNKFFSIETLNKGTYYLNRFFWNDYDIIKSSPNLSQYFENNKEFLSNEQNIIKSLSNNGSDLRPYFENNKEFLPDYVYKDIDKFSKKNYSFLVFRKQLPVKKKPQNINEMILEKSLAEKYKIKNDRFLEKHRFLSSSSILLQFPSPKIYCPIPLSVKSDEGAYSLIIILRDIAHLSNFYQKLIFNTKHFFYDRSDLNTTYKINNIISTSSNESGYMNTYNLPLNYTIITTKPGIKQFSEDEIYLNFEIPDIVDLFILYLSFFISFFIITKLFFKTHYIKIIIIFFITLLLNFSNSIFLVILFLLAIQKIGVFNNDFKIENFKNPLVYIMLTMSLLLVSYSLIVKSIFALYIMIGALLFYSLFIERKGSLYIIATLSITLIVKLFLNELYWLIY